MNFVLLNFNKLSTETECAKIIVFMQEAEAISHILMDLSKLPLKILDSSNFLRHIIALSCLLNVLYCLSVTIFHIIKLYPSDPNAT